MEKEININDIVRIETMPKVFEQLEMIGTFIEEQTKDIDILECTEENKNEVKKRRTEINNTLKLLDDKRKEIKTKLLEPYEIFNEKYEQECKGKLLSASEILKTKIDTIEEQQKKEKEEELKEFANQHIEANNLQDIISFENIGLNITLSASIKSLKEQILEFINKVVNDLKLIDMEEYKDEISIEYIQTLNFVDAKTKVIERHRMLDMLNEMQKKDDEKKQQEEKVVEKVEEAIEEITLPKEIIENDEVITVQFTVTDTKEKILKLKEFLKENDIKYE